MRALAMPALGLSERAVIALLIAGYAALQILQIANHQPWHDEYQAWQIAFDSPTPADVLRNIRFEGHPPVWHLLLWSAQKISRDVATLQVVQAAVSIACGAIILGAAPFPVWLRALVSLNYFVVFEYGVIARPYGIAMLLMLTALTLWRSPLAWIALAVIPLMSFHSALLAGVLAVERLTNPGRETRQQGAAGLVLFCAANLLALYFEWPDPQTIPALRPAEDVGLVARFIWFLWGSGALLFPATHMGGWYFSGAELPRIIAGFLAGVMLPFLLWQLTQGRALRRLMVFGLFALLAGFSLFVYPTRIRHAGIIILLLIAFAWIDAQRGGAVTSLFSRFSAWMAAMAVLVGGLALSQPFSYDGHVAAAVRAQVPSGAAIVTDPPSQILSALNGTPTFNIRKSCRETFLRWNMPKPLDLTVQQLDRSLLAAAMQAGGRIFVVSWFDPFPSTPEDTTPVIVGGLKLTSALQEPELSYEGLDVKVLGSWPFDRMRTKRYLLQIDVPGTTPAGVSIATRLPMCPG